jgi:type VI secretion system protein VasG
MMIGAGGQAGQADAANLLKPALARGELRTIAATTWAEYKKYFEQDAALARRFQLVKVEEPAEEIAVEMLRGLVVIQENHHKVRVLDEALIEAVRLSRRYITGRQLPDKAVSLLDTACARVALSQKSTPAVVEDCRRRVQQLEVSIGILEREKGIRADQAERIAAMTSAKEQAERELSTLKDRWRAELDRLREHLAVSSSAASQDAKPPDSGPVPTGAGESKETQDPAVADGVRCLTPDERDRVRRELAGFYHKINPGKDPLVHICVDAQVVAEIVAAWTGIPVGRMVEDEIKRVLALKPQLEQRIIGQSHALEILARRIHTARAKLTDPRRPLGVFLLVGPSGVGKTETAISLAELLYGGGQNMTTINMSEFKEEYKVSLLMGSPPGYVGYGEGGVLTEAVRRKPYSVVLLDEMEKAHASVHDIFYQVFDKGTLQDAAGRNIDFKNTLILMTSNAGTELITRLCADPATRPEPGKLAELLHPELLKWFKPAFLGRMTVIPYFTLADDVMRQIVQLQLEKIRQRIRENYKASFDHTPELVQAVAARCTEVDAGARNVDHILNGTLLPELSARFLARLAEGRPITAARVSADKAGQFQYEVT